MLLDFTISIRSQLSSSTSSIISVSFMRDSFFVSLFSCFLWLEIFFSRPLLLKKCKLHFLCGKGLAVAFRLDDLFQIVSPHMNNFYTLCHKTGLTSMM